MKIRSGYVSNSSSSSFLVPCEVSGRINSIKLPKEIWQSIEKNHLDWDGKKIDLSASDEWWLTEMVSDCLEEYSKISKIPHSVSYLEGNDEPYGCYDEGGEKDYIQFRKDGQRFYVLASDFIGEGGSSDIPESVQLRDAARRIFDSDALNKTQKLDALRKLFDF